MGFFVNIMRSLLFFFDQIIYSFIPTVYNFIKLLAGQTLFEATALEKIATNIYAILGVFMLFRLAFILLNAIIDPDKLTDKEKGVGKIFSRLIIALVLIVAIPWAFSFAFKLQKVVLDKAIVQKVILGTSVAADDIYGNKMAKIALSSFITCNPVSAVCNQCQLEADFESAFPTGEISQGCTGNEQSTSLGFSALGDHLNDKGTSLGAGGDVYTYNYTAGISTLCGAVILGMLIIFTFDIALRVVKLGFLQLFTPVAIMGYVAPKTGKGNIFDSWLKMSINTYLSLFIRLITIAFVIFIISLIGDIKNLNVSSNEDPITIAFLKVFILIGALMFAKEAPKMISNMLGLDEGTLGSLNPFSKLKNIAGAGLIGGAAGIGAKVFGAVGGGISGAYYAGKAGGSRLAGFGQGSKEGFKNIKVKDAAKGGITGIGKSLYGGTFGAFNKGGAYAKGKVTGKEEKVGLANMIKEKMAATAQEMHTGHATQDLYDTGKRLRDEVNAAANRTDWGRGNSTAYENARDKAAAIKRIFSNQEFGNAYERSKLASGNLKDEQELLTAYQNQLSINNARYQTTGDAAALAEVERLQDVIKRQTVNVSKYEETATLYKNEFEELKKKDYNKNDVKKLEALDHYDNTESARSRL